MVDLARFLAILQELRYRFLRILVVIGILLSIFLTFRLHFHPLSIVGITIPFAYVTPDPFSNIASQTFRALVVWTLPAGVTLINYGVGDSVLVQVETALLLSFIIGMPWIIHEAGAFLAPALRHREKALFRQIGLPALMLFALGFALGLLVLVPFTLRLLFLYVAGIGVAPFLGVQEFVTFVLLYSLAFGIAFELPVFVYALTRLGIVRSATWSRHWRGAVVGSLLFGLVVTPDNSGITMILVALPMIALYFGGVWSARRYERAKERHAIPPIPPPPLLAAEG